MHALISSVCMTMTWTGVLLEVTLTFTNFGYSAPSFAVYNTCMTRALLVIRGLTLDERFTNLVGMYNIVCTITVKRQAPAPSRLSEFTSKAYAP
jgi:hypothetical protein